MNRDFKPKDFVTCANTEGFGDCPNFTVGKTYLILGPTHNNQLLVIVDDELDLHYVSQDFLRKHFFLEED